MNTRHLEYFLAVADCGGFNRAAERLRVAQPSLSQAIRALERDLKVTLFVRTARHSVLTDVGRSLVEPTRQILRDLSTIQAAGLEDERDLHGQVNVAMSSSVASTTLPNMIREMHERHPQIKFAVHPVANSTESVDIVRSGTCELGFAAVYRSPPTRGLRASLFHEGRFVLIAPAGMFGSRTTISRRELAGVPLVVGERPTEMTRLAEDFAGLGMEPNITVWAGHPDAVIPLVLGGVGAAMVPAERARLAELGGADVLEIDPPITLRQWMVVRPGRLSPPARALYEQALRSMRNTAPLGTSS